MRTNFRKQFDSVLDACALARGIVDSVRDPLLVLDGGLRVLAASRSFYSTFSVCPEDTQGKLFYALGDGQWDIPKLRVVLEKIIAERGVMENYEVELELQHLGRRAMYLSACRVFCEGGADPTLLLHMEDVTEQRILEREKDGLLRQKDILLTELHHRVANSLTIIASIILLKANEVDSEETRVHLHDAHKRVMSIAAVQKHLHTSGSTASVEMMPYLSRLCEALAASMIGDTRPVAINVVGSGGTSTSQNAESLGLIATELVMNALKHAFPIGTLDNQITVAYHVDGANWKLSVGDNGIGRPDGVVGQTTTGIGTVIVKALAQQLGAQTETLAGPEGTTVTIYHTTFHLHTSSGL